MAADLINRAGVTHTLTNTNSGNVPATEDIGDDNDDSYDLDNDTYQGITAYDTGGGPENAELTVISEHTFEPATLEYIKYKTYLHCHSSSHYSSHREMHYIIAYKVGSTWTTIASYDSGVLTGNGEATKNEGLLTYTPASPIANVIGVRATVYAHGYATGGEGDVVKEGIGRIYEIQAWGNPYQDIGLRFADADGVVRKIGVEVTLASKLRIVKGGVTYGIPLVATDYPLASPIRIYDGSAVKSLGEVT